MHPHRNAPGTCASLTPDFHSAGAEAMAEKRIRGNWPASVLREFAALVDAGVPLLDALRSLSRHHRGLADVLPDALAGLQRGFQVGDVLRIAGAVSRQDAFLLNVAEQSGTLPTALNDLSSRQEVRLARRARLAGRLHLSRFVAVVLVATGMVSALAAGQAAGVVVTGGFLKLLFVFALLALIERAVMVDAATWLSLAWRLKLVPRWRRLQGLFEHYFYTVVRWQLAAGIPARDAVSIAAEALDAENFRSQAGTAAMDLQAGMSFHDAMLGNDLLFTPDLDQVIYTGETAGRLEQSLAQYQELQQVHMDIAAGSLLDWLPRLAYLLVVLLALDALSAFQPVPVID